MADIDANFFQLSASSLTTGRAASDWIPRPNGVWARYTETSVELRGPWTGVMGKPLPGWLDQIVQPLIRDFQLPAPISLSIGFGPSHHGHATLWIQEPADLGPCGFRIPDNVRGGELMVTLADELQEQFFLETAQAWGQPRPPCPEHQHPLYASTLEDTPYWFCPADNRPIAPIGQLSTQGST